MTAAAVVAAAVLAPYEGTPETETIIEATHALQKAVGGAGAEARGVALEIALDGISDPRMQTAVSQIEIEIGGGATTGGVQPTSAAVAVVTAAAAAMTEAATMTAPSVAGLIMTMLIATEQLIGQETARGGGETTVTDGDLPRLAENSVRSRSSSAITRPVGLAHDPGPGLGPQLNVMVPQPAPTSGDVQHPGASLRQRTINRPLGLGLGHHLVPAPLLALVSMLSARRDLNRCIGVKPA
jgi:hypothetical protein